VQAHQGRIHVETGQGHGSEFILEIPRALRARKTARTQIPTAVEIADPVGRS